MKQIISISITFIYLLLSLGIQVNNHYCGDELVSVDFYEDYGICACKNARTPRKCCKDVHKTFQLGEDQQKINYTFNLIKYKLPKFVPQVLKPGIYHFQNYQLLFDNLDVFRNISHETTPKIPLYLKNKVFRV